MESRTVAQQQEKPHSLGQASPALSDGPKAEQPRAGGRLPYLVLQRAVLPLRLLTNDDEVQVVVACFIAWQALHVDNVCEQV